MMDVRRMAPAPATTRTMGRCRGGCVGGRALCRPLIGQAPSKPGRHIKLLSVDCPLRFLHLQLVPTPEEMEEETRRHTPSILDPPGGVLAFAPSCSGWVAGAPRRPMVRPSSPGRTTSEQFLCQNRTLSTQAARYCFSIWSCNAHPD